MADAKARNPRLEEQALSSFPDTSSELGLEFSHTLRFSTVVHFIVSFPIVVVARTMKVGLRGVPPPRQIVYVEICSAQLRIRVFRQGRKKNFP